MSTTRRISYAELKKLKEIQQILQLEGIKLSQVELSEALVEYSIQHLEDFLFHIRQRAQLKQEDRAELMRLLFEPVDGKIETNAVPEHDVVT